MAHDLGSVGSIEQLHERFAGPLYLYAWRRLRDHGAAQETVQDTLLRAWRHADRFDPTLGSLPGWLFTIARNLTNDRLRRQGARPAEEPLDHDVAAPTDGDIDRVLEAWQLAEAMAQLSLQHRQVIVEVHYLGNTVREVAGRLGLPEGTVKSRLYYGLRSLRLLLEERGMTR